MRADQRLLQFRIFPTKYFVGPPSSTRMLRSIFILLMVLPLAANSARALTLESGRTKTHLLELFTSEGCSSCPPAEAWLSKLQNAPGLWRDFVPLAYHVDYWDRLGWRDSFAAKQWTARQYAYSASWKSGSVYTPGFVLDGSEWRERRLPENSRDEVGVLKAEVGNDGNVRASFVPKNGGARNFEVHVARLGFDRKIKVGAGENGGRELHHDFVVLAQTDAPMTSGKAELQLPGKSGDAREAIAVWVTERGQLEPLQAAGGWLR